jgi:hypothetical protein
MKVAHPFEIARSPEPADIRACIGEHCSLSVSANDHHATPCGQPGDAVQAKVHVDQG